MERFSPDRPVALSVTKRYIRALGKLAENKAYAVFAREVQRELSRSDVNIGEFIAPIATLPKDHLTDAERQWRRLADQETLLELLVGAPGARGHTLVDARIEDESAVTERHDVVERVNG